MMIDLTKFADGGDRAPFSRGDYSYATNGHIAVRVARRDDIAENEKAPKAENAFARAATQLGDRNGASSIAMLPTAPTKSCMKCRGFGKIVNCLECEGKGYRECDLGHEHDCEECDGDGVFSARHEMDASTGLRCERCGGTGTIPEIDEGRGVYIVFPGEHCVQFRYLLLISELPGVRWRLHGRSKEDPIPFWFEGGEGLPMPVRYQGRNLPGHIYIEDETTAATNGT